MCYFEPGDIALVENLWPLVRILTIKPKKIVGLERTIDKIVFLEAPRILENR